MILKSVDGRALMLNSHDFLVVRGNGRHLKFFWHLVNDDRMVEAA